MDSSVLHVNLPNSLMANLGVKAVWSPSSNKLAVHAFSPLSNNVQQQLSNFDSKILEFSENNILFDAVLSELINCSCSIFLSIQTLNESEPKEYLKELLNLSIQYRSVIRTCLDLLQEKFRKTIHSIDKEKYQNFITLFYSIECVWHLCEIFYVDIVPGDIILPKFQQWIRFHFPKFEKNAYKMLQMDPDDVELDDLDDFWNTIIGSVMQGRVDLARALLNLHPNRGHTSFQLADEILESMPIYQAFGISSLSEFHNRWKNWSLDCQTKIATRSFSTEPNLELIMKLVIGEEESFNEATECCETWYEMLSAWLFFNQQTVKYYDLGKSAKRLINKSNKSLKHLDFLILAVIEGDVYKLIDEIQQMSENGWFCTHIIDLLYHSGFLKSLDVKNNTISKELRDNFVMEYGTLLLSHNSFWQIGLLYLDHTADNVVANAKMELLLSHLPLQSEKRTFKILYEAEKRKMYNLVNNVSKIRSMMSLKRKRTGNALMWALRSQDGLLVSTISDEILKNYINTGDIDSADLLNNLGSAMLSSDKLIFLAKYCEYHRHRANQKLQEAANILMTLVSSKITPKYFWINLFQDICSLLVSTKRLFSSKDVYVVMGYLEAYSKCVEIPLDDKKSIHLTLSCYLSEILVHEACEK